MTGLEVDGIQMVGLAASTNRPVGVHASEQDEVSSAGLAWEPDKLVVGPGG